MFIMYATLNCQLQGTFGLYRQLEHLAFFEYGKKFKKLSLTSQQLQLSNPF